MHEGKTGFALLYTLFVFQLWSVPLVPGERQAFARGPINRWYHYLALPTKKSCTPFLFDILELDYGSMVSPFIVLLGGASDQIGSKLWLLWPEKCHVDFCGQPFASSRLPSPTTNSSPTPLEFFGQCHSLYGQVSGGFRTGLSTHPHLIANAGCSRALELTKVRNRCCLWFHPKSKLGA